MEQYFDIFAMIQPKNDRDISALLSEAMAELRSLNGHLKQISEAPVTEPA